MISVAFPGRGPILVRMNEHFLKGPRHVLEHLRAYLRTRSGRDWRVVGAFARDIPVPDSVAERLPRLASRGRVYDLARIAAEVNRIFFRGRVRCVVGWGRGGGRSRRGQRWIRFGSWQKATRSIRIHPLLDDRRVPEAFVRYIIFHEMLHAAVPTRKEAGRLLMHPKEYRVLERSFPGFADMKQTAREVVRAVLGGRSR
jgi:hypothetical protein